MSEPPRDDKAEEPTGSAPWERPRRWNDPRLDASRVDDLLATLGNEDEQSGRRHRRGSNKVPASDLIAAWLAGQPAQTAPGGGTEASAGDPFDAPTISRRTDAAASNANEHDASAGEDRTETLRRPTALHPSAGEDLTPTIRRPSADDPSAPEAAPGAVWAPGIGDTVTQQLPKSGLSEDVGSIRESLRQQHFGRNAQQRAVMPAAAVGAATTSTGQQPPGGHAAAGPALAASTAPAGRRRRSGGLMIAGRSAIAVLSAVLLVYLGMQWNLIQRTDAGLRDNGGTFLQPTDPNISTPSTAGTTAALTAAGTGTGTAKPVAPAVLPHYNPQNILLLGSDSRAGANGNAGNSNGQQGTAQSDTVMIAHISGDRQHVTILSIPRDLRVKAPTCKAWNPTTGKVGDSVEHVDPTTTWKITNAYAVGGPACTVLAVQKLTGLRLDQLIGIDFEGFKTMVDALHGVSVNVCRPIKDKTLGVVVLNGGPQTIRGDQALNLVRAREVIGDSSGDYGRIHRQQVVLSAMLRQVTSAGTLLNPGKLSDFLDAFVHATFTDHVTVDSLVQLSHQLGNLSPGKVTFYTLPAHPNPADNGDSQLADAVAPAVFAALVNDELLPGQSNAPTTKRSPASTPSRTASSILTSARTSTLPAPTEPATTGPTITGPTTTGPTTTVPTTTGPTTTAPQTISVDPAGIDLEIDNLTGTAGVAGQVADTLNGYGFKVTGADLVRPDRTQTGITVQYSNGNRDAAAVVAAAVPGSTLTLTPALGNKIKLMLGTSFHGTLTKVAVGQTLPSKLQTTPSSTAPRSTPRSTPSTTAASSSSSSPIRSAPHTRPTQKTAPGVKSSDIASVNAAQTACA
ncbi:MAG: LCP family protein [Actinomycetota bacterium]|nr:LCP family protein [Actinomycetota bacterium]